MKKTGLFDLMQNHIINNLVDYATGVETGLDSNLHLFGLQMEKDGKVHAITLKRLLI